MIVRIMADGQYELSDEAYQRLTAIDEHLLQSLESNEAAAFHRWFQEALSVVRAGEKLDESVLKPSDLVLPPADTTMQDARRLLETDSL